MSTEESRDGILYLLTYLRDQNIAEKTATLHFLSDLSPWEVEVFKKGFATYPEVKKIALVSALTDLAEADALLDFTPIFRSLLHDSVAEVRRQAIGGLWENEDTALAGIFVHLLHHDVSPDVRAAAAIALGVFLFRSEDGTLDQSIGLAVEDALFSTWYDPDELIEVRRRALESLAFLGDRVEQLIESAYYHQNQQMRVSSLFAMGRSLEPVWEKYVLTELESDDAALRYEAAIAAGELQLKEAVPFLSALAEEDDVLIAEAAIWALGEIVTPASYSALLSLAENEVLLERFRAEISAALDTWMLWAQSVGGSDDDDDLLYDFGEGDDLGVSYEDLPPL